MMAHSLRSVQEAKSRNGLKAALREKCGLVMLLAALESLNLASQHFRGYGLSAREMLIGTLILAAALILYAYVRAVRDAKEKERSSRIY